MENIISNEELQEIVHSLGVKDQLSKKDIDSLQMGEESPICFNMVLNDKTGSKILKSGKFKFIKENNEVSIKWEFLKDQALDIPKYILGKELSKDEMSLLENGLIYPVSYKGTDINVKVDKKSNTLSLMSNKNISEIKEIGGYKFSEQDIALWKAGDKLSPKVFFDKKTNQYFVANVQLRDGNRTLEFSNLKKISHTEAKQLINTLNNESLNVFDSVVRIAEEAIKSQPNLKSQDNTHDKIISNIKEAAATQNYEKIKEIEASNKEIIKNPSFSKVLTNALNTDEKFKDLPYEVKLATLISLNIESPSSVLESTVKADQIVQSTQHVKQDIAVKEEKAVSPGEEQENTPFIVNFSDLENGVPTSIDGHAIAKRDLLDGYYAIPRYGLAYTIDEKGQIQRELLNDEAVPEKSLVMNKDVEFGDRFKNEDKSKELELENQGFTIEENKSSNQSLSTDNEAIKETKSKGIKI